MYSCCIYRILIDIIWFFGQKLMKASFSLCSKYISSTSNCFAKQNIFSDFRLHLCTTHTFLNKLHFWDALLWYLQTFPMAPWDPDISKADIWTCSDIFKNALWTILKYRIQSLEWLLPRWVMRIIQKRVWIVLLLYSSLLECYI